MRFAVAFLALLLVLPASCEQAPERAPDAATRERQRRIDEAFKRAADPVPQAEHDWINEWKYLQGEWQAAKSNELARRDVGAQARRFFERKQEIVGWVGTVDRVTIGATGAVWAYAKYAGSTFEIRMSDSDAGAPPPAFARLQKGDAVRFSGKIGMEGSWTISGALEEPEMIVVATRIAWPGYEVVAAASASPLATARPDAAVAAQEQEQQAKVTAWEKRTDELRKGVSIENLRLVRARDSKGGESVAVLGRAVNHNGVALSDLAIHLALSGPEGTTANVAILRDKGDTLGAGDAARPGDLTGLKLIPRREYRVLYLPLAAANVLKGYGILALDRLVEAARYLDMDLGLVTGPLDAVDETPAADALGEHGF